MTTLPAGEAIGLDQSIAYAQQLAAFAGEHTPAGNDDYLTHLTAARVDGPGVATAREMQAAFAAAAAAAGRHAAELQQRTVQEAYDLTPDAGDKTYLTAAAAAAASTSRKDSAVTEPPGPRRGGYPDQPRAADGRWVKVHDVLGYADDETCFATDRVTGAGR